MACANDMLETLYGRNDNYDWTQHGMPQNKYERAAWTMKVNIQEKIFIYEHVKKNHSRSCMELPPPRREPSTSFSSPIP